MIIRQNTKQEQTKNWKYNNIETKYEYDTIDSTSISSAQHHVIAVGRKN